MLAGALRDRLGVETHLTTAGGGTRRSQAMTVPERLERRMGESFGDFGRMVDVTTVELGSLAPRRPAIIIDLTGQPDPCVANAAVLSPVLNGHAPEASIVSALWGPHPPQLGVRLATRQGWKTLQSSFVAIPDLEMTTRAP